MNDINTNEQEQALRDYELKQQRRYDFGKRVVIVVAIVNVILVYANLNSKSNLSSIGQVVLSVLLYKGFSYVRYLFVFGHLAGSLIILMLPFGESSPKDLSPLSIIFVIIMLLYTASTGILLAFNKGVKEFLADQKEKRIKRAQQNKDE